MLLMTFILCDDFEDKGPAWAEEETIIDVVKEIVENVLNGKVYHRSKIEVWTNLIGEKCLRSIANLQKPFKFIVEVSIMQRNGAGLHYATACFWDTSQDGTAYLLWENETIHCIVCIFGLSL